MSESKEKSTITKKGEINYANPIMIGQLKANKNFFENEKKRFLEMYKTSIDAGKINEQQVDQIIHNTIVEKNILEGVKQYLRQYFTANIDDGEKQFVIEQIKAQVKDMPEDKLEHAAKNIIFEKLLFNYLGNNEWGIKVTDGEVNDTLEQHYKATNQSIREFKENPARFEEIRAQVFTQKVIREIMKRFKVRAEVDLTTGTDQEQKN